METINKRITVQSRSDVYPIHFLGDLHLGSAVCDEAAITAAVAAIAEDPLALWVGTGDLGEFIPRQDWRHRQSQMAKWLREASADYCDDLVLMEIEQICGRLQPIADKCLGIVRGNHEDAHLRMFGRDVQREVCKRLQVDDLSDEAIIRLAFARDGTHADLLIYVAHGWFAGRKSGAKVNNLHDLLLTWDVDIAAVGHGHERVVAPPLVTYRLGRNGQLIEWRRYALMAGSFLRGHQKGATSYASARGFRGSDIGAVTMYYQPDKRRLWGVV